MSSPKNGWLPIDSPALVGYGLVDIWVDRREVSPNGEVVSAGHRVADAYLDDHGSWCDRDGAIIEGTFQGGRVIVTHWRNIPAGPEENGEEE